MIGGQLPRVPGLQHLHQVGDDLGAGEGAGLSREAGPGTPAHHGGRGAHGVLEGLLDQQQARAMEERLARGTTAGRLCASVSTTHQQREK